MDHEHFWKCIQHEFGEVHTHLQNILRIQSLCNQSLRLLTRESIVAIENDMRTMADYFINKCKNSKGSKEPSMRDIYGPRWETKPKEFTFLEGEILCLLGLAEYVQKKGIEGFLKFSKSSAVQNYISSVHKSIIPDESGTKVHVANLVQKIKSVYMALQIEEDPDFDRFVEKLDNLDVNWLAPSEKDNHLRASVQCPVCASEGHDRSITLKVDANGRWHIYSFTRHCDTYHYALPRMARQKQFIEAVEMDDAMDDSVSDPPSLGTGQIKIEEGENGSLEYFATS